MLMKQKEKKSILHWSGMSIIYFALFFTFLHIQTISSAKCPVIEVENAPEYTKCNGVYIINSNISVSWAPDQPVYKHTERNR